MERNERQYRPLNYTPYVPPLTSMGDTEVRQISGLPPSSDRTNPYYRRRTADNLPQPGHVYGTPAAARPGLTVSTTMNDLNNPAPKISRPRFPLIKRFTPTRIPSPIWDSKAGSRQVSTPVLPSQSTRKENVQHVAQGIQGPVSASGRPAPLLPKSRTMGMLSNFTTPFSRHNYSHGDNRLVSGSSKHPADVTASDPHYISLPLFTPNLHQIHTSQVNSYWCGRFQALCDRFNDEHLLLNTDITQQYDTDDSSSPPSTPTPSTKESYEFISNPFKEKEDHNCSGSGMSANRSEDQDRRSSRAFLHLQSLCTTNDARRSLWEFQLHFARMRGKPDLLPRGGKMVDERGSWFGRVGRAMVGGNNAGFGPRSSLGMSRRKSSVVSFLHP